MEIDPKILEFVTDGFRFDPQVVKNKDKHALPYNPNYLQEIFDNKNDLGNDTFIVKRTKSVVFNKYPINNNRVKSVKQSDENLNQVVSYEKHLQVADAAVKFKPKIYFKNKLYASLNVLESEGLFYFNNLIIY